MSLCLHNLARAEFFTLARPGKSLLLLLFGEQTKFPFSSVNCLHSQITVIGAPVSHPLVCPRPWSNLCQSSYLNPSCLLHHICSLACITPLTSLMHAWSHSHFQLYVYISFMHYWHILVFYLTDRLPYHSQMNPHIHNLSNILSLLNIAFSLNFTAGTVLYLTHMLHIMLWKHTHTLSHLYVTLFHIHLMPFYLTDVNTL